MRKVSKCTVDKRKTDTRVTEGEAQVEVSEYMRVMWLEAMWRVVRAVLTRVLLML